MAVKTIPETSKRENPDRPPPPSSEPLIGSALGAIEQNGKAIPRANSPYPETQSIKTRRFDDPHKVQKQKRKEKLEKHMEMRKELKLYQTGQLTP